MKQELGQIVDMPESRLIPLPRIDCPSPKVYEELQRRREYAGMTLDACLSNSKYKVEEVTPELDNKIIGEFNKSFYLIRDKKGNIVGEVKYNSGKNPFSVTSYDNCFEEKAKKLQKALNDYDKPVYKMPMPVDDEARIMPIGRYERAVKDAKQPIYN